ncbi:hypothetical protein [Calorimonas adulescens]|uniref:Uncharacterized protein n=1 Tax=Calorimonas adulescens TaxID=2606906 RepID=A0A5D8QCG8_9THEO|nr:hypothetical protein FWJ32_06015 [Calorimonas adulescens]
MSLTELFNKIKSYISASKCCSDKITLSVYGLTITMERRTGETIPHEVTVVVPRVECRKKIKDGEEEIEVILNSITVVHAPRHSLARQFQEKHKK